jgi:hypothetical protein
VAFSFYLGRNFFLYTGSLICSRVFILIPWCLYLFGPFLPLGGFPCLTWSILLTRGGFFGGFSFYLVVIFLQIHWRASSVGSPSHWAFPPAISFSYFLPPRNAIPGIPVDCLHTRAKACPVNWNTDHVKSLLQIISKTDQ